MRLKLKLKWFYRKHCAQNVGVRWIGICKWTVIENFRDSVLKLWKRHISRLTALKSNT